MVSFNYTDNTMTLGVNINAPPGTQIVESHTKWGWVIFGIVFSLIVIGVSTVLGIRALKRQKAAKKNGG